MPFVFGELDSNLYFNLCPEHQEPEWASYSALELVPFKISDVPGDREQTHAACYHDIELADVWTLYGRSERDGLAHLITDVPAQQAAAVAATLAMRSNLPCVFYSSMPMFFADIKKGVAHETT